MKYPHLNILNLGEFKVLYESKKICLASFVLGLVLLFLCVSLYAGLSSGNPSNATYCARIFEILAKA